MTVFLQIICFIIVMCIVNYFTSKYENLLEEKRNLRLSEKDEWQIFPKKGIRKKCRYTLINWQDIGFDSRCTSTYKYIIEKDIVTIKLIKSTIRRFIEKELVIVENGILKNSFEFDLRNRMFKLTEKEIQNQLEEIRKAIAGTELEDGPLKQFVLNAK